MPDDNDNAIGDSSTPSSSWFVFVSPFDKFSNKNRNPKGVGFLRMLWLQLCLIRLWLKDDAIDSYTSTTASGDT